MTIFIIGFWLLCLLCVIIFFKSNQLVEFSNDNNFKKFQQVYLSVYLLAAAGDWLQGPYIYELYKQYGFSTLEINQLFLAGYGSSLLFGTIVGSLADKFGRKKNCILYSIFYIASCITKHFPNYNILFLGRILSGVATSILCSAFESWMICEHHVRTYDHDSLPSTFSQIVFGNSIAAILSGVSAQMLVDTFGFVAPYDLAILIFVIMRVLIIVLWNENYGDKNVKLLRSFKNAAHVVISDRKVQCLGIVQSLFEASMYIFVLEWTPTLTPNDNIPAISNTTVPIYSDGHRGQIPHGYIFASFMVAIMIGSMLFKISCKHIKPCLFLRYLLMVAAACFFVLVIFREVQATAYICFVIFEISVGAFWPSIGTLRSEYIPEQSRATVMCLFRVPLNIIVIIILTRDLSINFVFCCCFIFLVLATITQCKFNKLTCQTTSLHANIQQISNNEIPQPTDILMPEHS